MSHKYVQDVSLPNTLTQDILCQVDDQEYLPDALNVASIDVQGDSAYLTIIVPVSLLESFKDFLSSSLQISQYIKKQVQVKKAVNKASSLEYQEQLKIQFQKFSDHVLKIYDLHYFAGLSIRQAIRKTRDDLNNFGSREVTCYSVELICRENKRLSKQWRLANDKKRKETQTE